MYERENSEAEGHDNTISSYPNRNCKNVFPMRSLTSYCGLNAYSSGSHNLHLDFRLSHRTGYPTDCGATKYKSNMQKYFCPLRIHPNTSSYTRQRSFVPKEEILRSIWRAIQKQLEQVFEQLPPEQKHVFQNCSIVAPYNIGKTPGYLNIRKKATTEV